MSINNPRTLRLKDVLVQTGLSRSTIYSLIDQGLFPKPFKISTRAIGWDEDSIEAFLERRKVASR